MYAESFFDAGLPKVWCNGEAAHAPDWLAELSTRERATNGFMEIEHWQHAARERCGPAYSWALAITYRLFESLRVEAPFGFGFEVRLDMEAGRWTFDAVTWRNANLSRNLNFRKNPSQRVYHEPVSF